MKRICVDACTLILLAKASVLEALADEYALSITSAVYTEVIAGKKYLFADALLVERLYHEHKLVLNKSAETLSKKLMEDFNMEMGEASTIAVCIQEKIIVATDNRQGRKAAVVNNLPLVGSIELIMALWRKKKIDATKTKTALNILQREGWFSPYLIETALGDLHEQS